MRYRIARIDDLPPGSLRQYWIEDTEVLIVNNSGRILALAARCTHAGAPLGEGSLDGNVLTCPWHGSQFDITDGTVLNGPAEEALKTYRVTVQDGRVTVEIE